MLKLADYQRKRQNKHFLKKYYFTSLKFMCTVKQLLCTLVYTGAHREDHWSNVLTLFFTKL